MMHKCFCGWPLCGHRWALPSSFTATFSVTEPIRDEDKEETFHDKPKLQLEACM